MRSNSCFPARAGVGRYYFCRKCKRRFSLKGKIHFFGTVKNPKCPKCGGSDTGSGDAWKAKEENDKMFKH